MRRQAAHCDLNPHNVMVAAGRPDRVAGVIDFGDMVHTALAADAAIGASDFAGDDPDAPGSSGQLAGRIVNAMREKGVLISTSGAAGDTLKIRPPLVFSDADTDQFMAALEQVLDEETRG